MDEKTSLPKCPQTKWKSTKQKADGTCEHKNDSKPNEIKRKKKKQKMYWKKWTQIKCQQGRYFVGIKKNAHTHTHTTEAPFTVWDGQQVKQNGRTK